MTDPLALDRLGQLVAELGAEFEVDLDMVRDALLHGRSCNIFYLPTVMKIDLFAVNNQRHLYTSVKDRHYRL